MLDTVTELSEDFLVKFRDAVKERNSDGVIIGEVWEDATGEDLSDCSACKEDKKEGE